MSAHHEAAMTPEALRNFLEAIVTQHGCNDHAWLVRCARDLLAAAQPAPGGQETGPTRIVMTCPNCASVAQERIAGLWLCQACGHEWNEPASPSRATTPAAEPWDIHRMCTKCVTASHCAHHQRCLAECTPADLAAPPETGEMPEICNGDVVDLDGFRLRPVFPQSVRVLQGNDGVRAIYRKVWSRSAPPAQEAR